jgi:hypothetical protein
MKKLIINTNRRSSIDPSITIDNADRSDFKDCTYIIENRVVGLKKLPLKEQKNIIGMSVRTLDLPNNFSLRIVELSNLFGNGKNESRFKITPKS